MRKISIISLAGLLTALTLSASTLTPEQALQRIANSIPTRSSDISELNLSETIYLQNGEAGLYIFDKGSESGFIILSADDVAAPMLGFCDHGTYDENTISPEMKWWLAEYGRQIEYARENSAPVYKEMPTRGVKDAIAPLVKTKWDQGTPYNLMTPDIDGKNCVAGCVATAMAQVMKYWNYPEIGSGEGECTVTLPEGGSRKEKMQFDEQEFDWANMLDTYKGNATDEQNQAVAYLMKACGYAVGMNYGLKQSSAALYYVSTSLISKFGYNRNIQFCQRDYYSLSDWSDLIYDELSAGRPVAYGGQSKDGGHAFICDGYDSDGYFHFNWGWSGVSDGYFLLNALNPNSLGIGANGGGYNFSQDVIVGIQPGLGEELYPNYAQSGNLLASASGTTLTLTGSDNGGWYNRSSNTITVDIAARIEPIAPSTGTSTTLEIMKNKELKPNYGFRSLKVDVQSIKDGTYRLTLCYRKSNTTEWIPVRCNSEYFNYIDFTKVINRITVQKNGEAVPDIENAEILTPLFYGEAFKMSVTVTNPNDKEITNNIYPALYKDGVPQMIADGITLTLAPGESVTQEIITIFELTNSQKAPDKETDYTLCFYDPSRYHDKESELSCYGGFSKDVTMKINKDGVKLTINKFTIDGYEKERKNGHFFYKVTDQNTIPFTIRFINKGEYFGKPVGLLVFPYESGQVYSMAYETFSPLVFLSQGEEATLTANLNFYSGEIGKSYFAVPYINGKQYSSTIYFTLEERSGVEDVASDEGILVAYDKSTRRLVVAGEVSSLVITGVNGIVFDKTEEAAGGSVDLSNLPAGIYVVKAVTPAGDCKVLKIKL